MIFLGWCIAIVCYAILAALAGRMCYVAIDSAYPEQNGEMDEEDSFLIHLCMVFAPLSIPIIAVRYIVCKIGDFATSRPTARMKAVQKQQELESHNEELNAIVRELEGERIGNIPSDRPSYDRFRPGR